MKESPETRKVQSPLQQPRVVGNTVLKEEFFEEMADEGGKGFIRPDLKLVPHVNEDTKGVVLTESSIEEFNQAMEIFKAEQDRRRALAKPKDEEINEPRDEEINIFDIENTRRIHAKNELQRTLSVDQDPHHGDTRTQDGTDGVPLPRSTEQSSLAERLSVLVTKFNETSDTYEKTNLGVEIKEIRNALEEEVGGKILKETERLQKLRNENGDEHHEVIQAGKRIDAYKKIYESIKNLQ